MTTRVSSLRLASAMSLVVVGCVLLASPTPVAAGNGHVCIHDEIHKRQNNTRTKIDVKYPEDAWFPPDESELQEDEKGDAGHHHDHDHHDGHAHHDHDHGGQQHKDTKNNKAHAGKPPRRRALRPQQVNFQSMRVQYVFDPTPCTAGSSNQCGQCTSVGATVRVYSGGATVTCTADDVLTDEKKDYIMNELMPKASEFIQSALKVVPVSGNLVVSTSECGNTGSGIAVPAAHRTSGIANVDFFIYVTAVPMSDPNSATVAWALGCVDDRNGRPVVGHVNWVPKRLTNAAPKNPIDLEDDVNTGIHEISHALGFSSNFFGSRGYLNEAGTAYVKGPGSSDFGLVTSTSTTLGKQVRKMMSPRVLREARLYFGCSTLDGVEIEDQGGSGTQGSHWEKRIMAQEYMSGISTTVRSYISKMSLAFFEDTGHYQADYSTAQTKMNWGKGKGCAFVDEKCSSATNIAGGEFCTDRPAAGGGNRVGMCTHDRLARGYCGVGKYSSLPSNFQFFSDNAQDGGTIEVQDFCPSVLAFSNLVCIKSSNRDTQDIYGSTYSLGSRCFESTLRDSAYGAVTAATDARCFAVACSSTNSLLLTIKGTTVRCPSDGSAGNADLSPISSRFNGFIKCPLASTICTTPDPTAPPTPLPPTPQPTPLPPGATYAPTAAPTLPPTPVPTLGADCAARVPDIEGVEKLMPACRQVAATLVRRLGTNCDPQLIAFLTAKGLAAKCANKAALAEECQEGISGVKDLCGLLEGGASAGASLLWAVVVSVAALLLAV